MIDGNITKCKYNKNGPDNVNSSIQLTMDGQEYTVPIDVDNRHYQMIQEWVAEGNTIEEAD
tara:strand:+ start:421 stop:603 length:183 start_codon:yes stop_codon:yes gene_type:complete